MHFKKSRELLTSYNSFYWRVLLSSFVLTQMQSWYKKSFKCNVPTFETFVQLILIEFANCEANRPLLYAQFAQVLFVVCCFVQKWKLPRADFHSDDNNAAFPHPPLRQPGLGLVWEGWTSECWFLRALLCREKMVWGWLEVEGHFCRHILLIARDQRIPGLTHNYESSFEIRIYIFLLEKSVLQDIL